MWSKRLSKRSLILALGAVLATASSASALWFITDMFDMPSVKPQEGEPRGLPEGAVSTNGPFVGTDYTMANRAELEASLPASNPVEATPESLAKGKWLYDTYCQVCHGDTGTGDGPVALKAPAVKPWFPLYSATTQNRSDPFLYAQIWVGGAVMGPYWMALEPEEVWHLVNYIRSMKAEQ